jgi:hypothetical protein
MFEFNSERLTRGRLRPTPFRVEKHVGGEWRRMSDWPQNFDEGALQRHASALGGSVRFVQAKGDAVVREWRNGQEIHP